MKSLIFAAISRDIEFSPNHIGNDAAIFSAVVSYLTNCGHQVNLYTESEFLEKSVSEKLIFSMVRSKEAICHLQLLEKTGVMVINSGFGVANCLRENMTNKLINNNIPYPKSLVVNTNNVDLCVSEIQNILPCWIKRADFQAVLKNDVAYLQTIDELYSMINDYASRGINRVVINQHLDGDLIKFYGVKNSDFFYWFYPHKYSHSKFGLEKINGAPRDFVFSIDKLKQLCSIAANALQVHIYGGDCIVSEDGTISIIDFNDWPSFAPCRDEASIAIGKTILLEAKKYIND